METARIGTFVDIYQDVVRLNNYQDISPHKYELRLMLDTITDQLENDQPRDNKIFNLKGGNFEDAGFHPFINTCALSQKFRDISQEIEIGPVNDELFENWQERCKVKLRNLVRDFYKRYLVEIHDSMVFIPDADHSDNYKYYSEKDWLTVRGEDIIFSILPQIAQNCFRDGARCIAFGLYRPALSLCAQAVEATIRYCYQRMIVPNKNSDRRSEKADDQNTEKYTKTSTMINELCKEKFIDSTLKEILTDILDTRNKLSHGRATQELTLPGKAREKFDLWWKTTKNLIIRQDGKLLIHLHIPSHLSFDVALSTYLFRNWEMPEISTSISEPKPYNHYVFNSERCENNNLYDETVKHSLVKKGSQSLSQVVSVYINPQDGFGIQIKKLIQYTEKRQEGFRENLDPANHFSFDIADLFYGICNIKNKPLIFLS